MKLSWCSFRRISRTRKVVFRINPVMIARNTITPKKKRMPSRQLRNIQLMLSAMARTTRQMPSTMKNAIFMVLGSCLVVLAIALNISWIFLNWREGILFFFGVIVFLAIITGLILNTTFLVREIRRNEHHDSFINAVTHELKTPITSIRLYLETLQRREVDDKQRQQFYQLMLED